MKITLLMTTALLALSVSGCADRASVVYADGRDYRGGPPPHAPAHGYRAKHQRHNMVYDSRLGAYIVLGYDDHYYNDGWYFRYRDGLWQINADLRDRDWRDVDHYRVPEGLRYSKHGYRDRDYEDRGRDNKDKNRGRGYKDRDEHPGQGRGPNTDDDWD
jgi:hypothetical protein